MRLNNRNQSWGRRCNFPRKGTDPPSFILLEFWAIEWDRRDSVDLLYLSPGPSSSRAEGPMSPVQCQCEAFCNPGLGPSAPDWTTSLQSKTTPWSLLATHSVSSLAASTNFLHLLCPWISDSTSLPILPGSLCVAPDGIAPDGTIWGHCDIPAKPFYICKSLHVQCALATNKTDFSEQLRSSKLQQLPDQ